MGNESSAHNVNLNEVDNTLWVQQNINYLDKDDENKHFNM